MFFLRRLACGAAAASVVAFFVLQLLRFFWPPLLTVQSPRDWLFLRDSQALAQGEGRPGGRLTINGEVVYADPQRGTFTLTLPLERGLNTFVFRMEDTRGRAREVVRRVYRF